MVQSEIKQETKDIHFIEHEGESSMTGSRIADVLHPQRKRGQDQFGSLRTLPRDI